MAYPKVNTDPELLNIKTNDDENTELIIITEKQVYKIILKSFKIDGEFYKKKKTSLTKKNVIMIILKTLIGSVGLGVGSGLTISGLAPVEMMCASSSPLLSSISTLITSEFFSKVKVGYNKLGDCVNVITFLYKIPLKPSIIEQNFNEKEANELQKIYNPFLIGALIFWILLNSRLKIYWVI